MVQVINIHNSSDLNGNSENNDKLWLSPYMRQILTHTQFVFFLSEHIPINFIHEKQVWKGNIYVFYGFRSHDHNLQVNEMKSTKIYIGSTALNKLHKYSNVHIRKPNFFSNRTTRHVIIERSSKLREAFFVRFRWVSSSCVA